MSANNEHAHRHLEKRFLQMTLLTAVLILIGGLVEIVPMFTVSAGAQTLDGVTPYTPLELSGRGIYLREGCYNCHSQMVRPFRSETLRYGPWSRAGEYVYDRPFQLGSRRIGPDLHRVGGKYPDAWHYEHMKDPRTITENSIMPAYPWLFGARVSVEEVQGMMSANARLDSSYSQADIDGAGAAMDSQGKAIVGRLKGASIDAQPDEEIIALIAYLQRLGADGRTALAEAGK